MDKSFEEKSSWDEIAAYIVELMLVSLAVAALAERKIGKKGWRRMMRPLGGKRDV